MDIKSINNLLNGKKYIPKLKKDKLLERKNFLEGKSKKHIIKEFNHDINDFPSLLKETTDTTKTKNNNVWTTNISNKIYDNKNVPEIPKKDILKTEKKDTNNLELTNELTNEYDNEYYDDDYDDDYIDDY